MRNQIWLNGLLLNAYIVFVGNQKEDRELLTPKICYSNNTSSSRIEL